MTSQANARGQLHGFLKTDKKTLDTFLQLDLGWRSSRMKKKSASWSAFLSLRASITLLTCAAAACSMISGALLAFVRLEAPAKASQRMLTFEERVAYQRAIEEVYWRHRIWPKERPDPKPPLDAMMSQTQIERKVEDYLRDSQAVEDYSQTPLTAEQLQAEMDRIAKHTKRPEVLLELFEALGNDAFVIAECLARPVLSSSLVRDLYAHDQRLNGELKRRVEFWQRTAKTQTPNVMAAVRANYSLPTISGGAGCADDSWTATSVTSAPDGRQDQTAVWTGTEMIVWGGWNLSNVFNTGGRYNPATDSWTATSTTNAPTGRWSHTAVWTGSEMIVWGGVVCGFANCYLNTGARYNPGTDTWTTTNIVDAPHPRASHRAVWTGSEMIVWGGTFFDGTNHYLNTGGRYNPGTDTWTATSMTNVPEGRFRHTAVWNGNEMIVWGGLGDTNGFNTGGRYNPGTDSWIPTSTTNVPLGRFAHTAVWTGSEMIVWGGGNFFQYLNTGGKYNPGSDSWTATSMTNVPDGRFYHTAVWTGTEMIIWGGTNDSIVFNTGGRYNPGSDSWTATSTNNAPHGRTYHTAVWNGPEMIVWGGYGGGTFYLHSGGKYCAQSGPTPTPTPGPIALSASGRKVEGINTVRLTWSGATSTNIDVYRNGAHPIATVPNTGMYTDSTGDTDRARYTYRVCEAGTSTCSNDATVRFRH